MLIRRRLEIRFGTMAEEGDSSTSIDMDKLQVDKLLGYDATLKQDATAPQILIYHTHSQEAYADSVPGSYL